MGMFTKTNTAWTVATAVINWKQWWVGTLTRSNTAWTVDTGYQLEAMMCGDVYHAILDGQLTQGFSVGNYEVWACLPQAILHGQLAQDVSVRSHDVWGCLPRAIPDG